MNEQIRVHEVSADAEGTLDRQADGYFDLREAPDGDNLRRLLLRKITADVKNVAAEWERSVYKPIITETEIIPPQYFGDSIRFYWSRPFTETEYRAEVAEESYKALEAAVDAVVSAGFDIMEHTRNRKRRT